MRRHTFFIKKTAYIGAAVMAGICIFMILTAAYANSVLLTPDYHRKLFEKNNIYTQVQDVISGSMATFAENVHKNLSKSSENDTEILNAFIKSVTPEMIRNNIDSLRDGLFQYFRGERRFLPDIYLNMDAQADSTDPDASFNSKVASQALSKVEKINLSAILLYINRNDISDSLLEIKMVYYLLDRLPGFLFLFFLLAAFIGVILCKKLADITRWASIALLSGGIVGLLSGLGLLICSYFIFPENIYPVAVSLPLQTETLLAYIRDCTLPLTFFLLLSCVFSLLLGAVLHTLPRYFPGLFKTAGDGTQAAPGKHFHIVKYGLYAFLFLLICFAIGYQTYGIKKDFEVNDFTSVLARLKSTHTYTEVIPARDETIYAFELKLVDHKTNKPVPNVQVNVNGRSGEMKKDFNETAAVNESGTAKFTLDKGAFRLSFDSSGFPAEYQMPSPLFFELEQPGTTIITINLDASPEKQKWGIAEIEVLDEDNKPVPYLELNILNFVLAPGYPDSVYTYTNTEGIAVFKVNEGNYKVNFTEAKFPKKYIMPPILDIGVKPGAVTRYTFRLSVENTAASASASSSPRPSATPSGR